MMSQQLPSRASWSYRSASVEPSNVYDRGGLWLMICPPMRSMAFSTTPSGKMLATQGPPSIHGPPPRMNATQLLDSSIVAATVPKPLHEDLSMVSAARRQEGGTPVRGQIAACQRARGKKHETVPHGKGNGVWDIPHLDCRVSIQIVEHHAAGRALLDDVGQNGCRDCVRVEIAVSLNVGCHGRGAGHQTLDVFKRNGSPIEPWRDCKEQDPPFPAAAG